MNRLEVIRVEEEEIKYRRVIQGLVLPLELKNPLLQASEAREARASLGWMKGCRAAHPNLPGWMPEIYIV